LPFDVTAEFGMPFLAAATQRSQADALQWVKGSSRNPSKLAALLASQNSSLVFLLIFRPDQVLIRASWNLAARLSSCQKQSNVPRMVAHRCEVGERN
jgi:hypothetical protein